MVPRVRDALSYCSRREHLRRTLRIAFVVGVVLTAINQLDVILRGDASAVTAVKCALNFLVPFVVSNLGLLSGRSTAPRRLCAAAPHDARQDPGAR
jgi:hypothetical protein